METYILLLTLLIRDDGRYSQVDPELKKWFDNLKNDQGELCCSNADGDDVSWRTKDGRYEVYLNDHWQEVPEDTVLKIPSKINKARVWTVPQWGLDGKRFLKIRCFLPGPLT